MKTKTIAAIVIIAMLLAIGVAIAAGPRQTGKGGMQPGKGGMQQGMQGAGIGMCLGVGPKVIAELNLTQEQRTKLQQICANFRAATETYRNELKAEAATLKNLITAQTPNANAIKNQLAKMDQIRAEIRNLAVDRFISALNVLTPEQREKVRSAIKNAPGFGFGMGKGFGMGMGADADDYPTGCPAGPGGGYGKKAGCCPLLPR